MLYKLQLQNLDQPLCSKSEQKFSFRTNRQLPNLDFFLNFTNFSSSASPNVNVVNALLLGAIVLIGMKYEL